MFDSALKFLRKRYKFFLSLLLLFIIGAVFISQNLITFKKATASNITVSAFTASSYTLSAADVTYTFTFTAPVDIDDSGYFQFGLDGGFSDGTGADFTGVSINTLTAGENIKDHARVQLNSPQNEIVSGFILYLDQNGGTTVAAGSEVVIAMAGITNPSFGSSYSASVGDSGGNETTSGTSASQAFGTPMLKIKIADPNGSPVPDANVWICSTSMDNYSSAGGQTDVAGQWFMFSDELAGPEGASVDGEYFVNINPPFDSEFTQPPQYYGYSGGRFN